MNRLSLKNFNDKILKTFNDKILKIFNEQLLQLLEDHFLGLGLMLEAASGSPHIFQV